MGGGGERGNVQWGEEGDGVMGDGEEEEGVMWNGGEKGMEMEEKGMGRGMKRREYKCEGKRENMEGRRRARGDVEEVEGGKI